MELLMKVMVIIGTRPEAIKMAPVARSLAAAGTEVRIVCTSQHRDLLRPFLSLLQLRIDVDLEVMRKNQTPAQVIRRILQTLPPLLTRERPDWVLVQGDTASAFAAALAAFYQRMPVGHVEAGLRTFDAGDPFPEEMHRQVIARLASRHFAPTASARDNLLREQIAGSTVVVTGNPVVDSLQWMLAREQPGCVDDLLPAEPGRRLVLLTAHRRESIGRGLNRICDAVAILAERYGAGWHVIVPVHPNPNVQATMQSRLRGLAGVHLVPPLSYDRLIPLLSRCFLVLTDSGGIQEEAPSLGRPVLVLRRHTDRPEAVSAGSVRVVGTETPSIMAAFREWWEDAAAYRRAAQAVNPYGDGRAGERIAASLNGQPVEAFSPACH
jgi:UDP-N-acetylglucosamine 2-epimerase (non-hydrolysing)